MGQGIRRLLPCCIETAAETIASARAESFGKTEGYKASGLIVAAKPRLVAYRTVTILFDFLASDGADIL